MPLRIGVVTFHYAVNYGAVLQAYGLVQRLELAGHEVEVIDFRSPTARRYMLRALAGSRWKPAPMWRDFRKQRLFMRFLKKHLRLSPRTYTEAEQTADLATRYDAVVTGSDQVWNTRTFGYEPPFFLGFADPDRTRLISYAPSVGVTDDWGPHTAEATRLLGRFHDLSARDEPTADLVEAAIGRRPTMVLDPTLISDFDGLIDDRPASPEPYLLVYHVQKSEIVDRWVDLVKRRLGLRAIVVGKPCATADETHIVVSPERWLGYFKNAAMVVTNSFHGTIFSMKYRRPFVVAPHPKGSMRMADLLGRVGSSERLLSVEADESALPADLETPDFDAIHARLADPIDRSRRFLDEAIAAAAS